MKEFLKLFTNIYVIVTIGCLLICLEGLIVGVGYSIYFKHKDNQKDKK